MPIEIPGRAQRPLSGVQPRYNAQTKAYEVSTPNAKSSPQGTALPSLTDMFKGLGLSGGGFTGPMPSRASTMGGGGAGAGSNTNIKASTSPGLGAGQFNVNSQLNPQLQAMAGKYSQFGSQLAQGSDQDAILAMQRQRDLLSGMAKEFEGQASQQGILGSGAAQQELLNKIVNPGQAQIQQLNANLTSDARNKQFQALSGEAGLTGQQAGWQQAQQQLGLDAWKAQQQNEIARAQVQASMQNQQMNQMLSLVGLLNNMYTGF